MNPASFHLPFVPVVLFVFVFSFVFLFVFHSRPVCATQG